MATEARIDPTGIGHANSGRNGQTEKARLSGKLKCEVPKSAASSPRWGGESRGGQRLGSGHIWGEGGWAGGRAVGGGGGGGGGGRRRLWGAASSPAGPGRGADVGDWDPTVSWARAIFPRGRGENREGRGLGYPALFWGEGGWARGDSATR